MSVPMTADRARESCWNSPASSVPRKNADTIWLAFLDGEEAFNMQWVDPDNTYGSRELAASLALAGTLRHIKAMILVDMVGPAKPIYKRETNSTKWLTDILWTTAAGLGYGKIFVNDSTPIEDDHLAFLSRDVPGGRHHRFGCPLLAHHAGHAR